MHNEFKVGDKVRHARYGVGEVVEAGAGRVVVRQGTFERTFVPEIAPLTLVAAGALTVADGEQDAAVDDSSVDPLAILNDILGTDLFDAFDAFGGPDEESTPSSSRKLYSTQRKGGREKGYAKWAPQKRTKVILAQVRAILSEYEAELPLTARQIFYRLVGKYGYPKTESAYESLTNWLVRARRSRAIPFESIRDDGASVMEGKFYTGEEDFYRYLHDEAKSYERDKLAGQQRDIRVYVESAGMMPQLVRVARRYSVPVYSCSGFDSLTAKYDLADDVAKAFNWHGRQTVILHLGDMDPSGETIFDAISEDVYSFLEVDVPHKRPEDVAIFERVALTQELVEEYDLPTDPAKESSHSASWGARRACQLEALAPDVLADIVRAAIESHMDLDILKADRKAEVDERRKIAKALPAPQIAEE